MKRPVTGCVLFFAFFGSPLSAQKSLPSAQTEARQGAQALERGDFGAAEQHLSAALKIDPALAEVRANLGLAYYADHQYQKAIAEFERALARNPALETARSFLPLSQAALGDCAAARPGLEREFGSGSNPKLRRVLGLSLERCSLEADRQAEAGEVAQKLLAAYPDDPDVLYAAGELYGKLSSEIYLRLMKVAPNSPRGYQLTASVAATDGNWKGALDAYHRALKLDPGLEGVHLQIAILLLTHSPDPEAWRPALIELNDELKVNPASAQAEYEIGEIYRKHGQLKPAVLAFERALQRDPAAVPVRLGLAKALHQLGRRAEALAALEPARDSEDPGIHFLLAQIYRESGKQAEAQKETAIFERLQRAPQPLEAGPESQP